MLSLEELIDRIDELDNAYYNDFKSLVSDPEYDGLKDQLRSRSVEFFASKKPTAKKELAKREALEARIKDALSRIGAPPPDGDWPKYLHEVPMASLNKANTPDELGIWARKCFPNDKKTLILLTEKMDGMSISLKYVNGKLFVGATRGDGDAGENITRNIRKMWGVPLEIKGFDGHIRGEVILLRSLWQKHFPDMANTRNATAMAKRSDGEGCEHLTIFAYTVEDKDFKTELEAYTWLKSVGFNVPKFVVGTAAEFVQLWSKYMDEVRETLDYDIDGLVGHINDRALRLSLGEEGRGPKGSVAFKFEAPEARTTTTDIVCQVGDTGIITPVAEFEEVELMGARIKRASLHNFSLVKELGINIGAEIIVVRANDVIPHVKRVTKPNNGYFHIPETCPECGTKTIRVGEYVRCPNKKTCPAQVIGRLNKWIKELNILEWGESVLRKLIAAGLVTDVADLYRLTAKDITSLDRMGDKGAANLLGELDKFRTVTLENFIGGLCIDGVATSTVKSVMEAGHDTLDKLLALKVDDLESLHGFGEIKALAVCAGLAKNADRIKDIQAAGVTIKKKITGSLTGMHFAFTGTMQTPRKQLQSMVAAAGGEFDKSVSKKTNYLVIDDPASGTDKAVAARKLGTKLISEADFLAMVQ